MAKMKSIPTRNKVKTGDTWNLTKTFKSDAAWEKGYLALESMVPGFEKFRGKLGKSAKVIRDCCDFESEFEMLGEKLGVYAFLKSTEDVANSEYQGMVGRFTYLATQAGEMASFIAPELQAIPKKTMEKYIKSATLKNYRYSLEKLMRYRPHILSMKEERLLAMQGEVAGSASKIFGQLNDADMKFGFVTNEHGEKVELTHGSAGVLMESPKRSVRKKAFTQFYGVYEDHANTLATTLSSSVLQDVYGARVRNHPSAREAALFSDRVPVAVYDSLIEAVHNNLDTLYKYYDIRKRALGLRKIATWDGRAPLIDEGKVNIPYAKAVDIVCESVAPLGINYGKVLRKGLLEDRWVDRYENKGKRSGAFSYGAYGTPPYIMMNYKADSLDSMFTLTHEAGHSMHTWHSNKYQPYTYAHYTIFVAEVASTFNEQLLNRHLMAKAKTKKEKTRLICKEIDEIRGTIIRQTMFAEYEKIIHALAEQGQPLTLEVLRAEYRKLLDLYFGPNVEIPEALELEGMRIPHFYSAFYVYKYATGLSAAIALSRKVLNGGKKELTKYLNFLKSGGSKYPLDLLRDAGVDLEQPGPVDSAMQRFRELVDELDELI